MNLSNIPITSIAASGGVQWQDVEEGVQVDDDKSRVEADPISKLNSLDPWTSCLTFSIINPHLHGYRRHQRPFLSFFLQDYHRSIVGDLTVYNLPDDWILSKLRPSHHG